MHNLRSLHIIASGANLFSDSLKKQLPFSALKHQAKVRVHLLESHFNISFSLNLKLHGHDVYRFETSHMPINFFSLVEVYF